MHYCSSTRASTSEIQRNPSIGMGSAFRRIRIFELGCRRQYESPRNNKAINPTPETAAIASLLESRRGDGSGSGGFKGIVSVSIPRASSLRLSSSSVIFLRPSLQGFSCATNDKKLLSPFHSHLPSLGGGICCGSCENKAFSSLIRSEKPHAHAHSIKLPFSPGRGRNEYSNDCRARSLLTTRFS